MATLTTSSLWDFLHTKSINKHKAQWPALFSWLTSTLTLVLGLTLVKKGIGLLLLKLYEYFIEKNMLKL